MYEGNWSQRRHKVCGVGRDVLDTKESSRRMLVSLTTKARDLVSSRARSSLSMCNNETKLLSAERAQCLFLLSCILNQREKIQAVYGLIYHR